MRTALTIAGSDSSGGAGIQADLKTFAAHGVFGMSAITAVTVQNTQGVFAVHDIPDSIVTGQIDAVFNDIRPDSVKIGMVSSVPIIEAISESLRLYGADNVVLDPVMVSTSGHSLLHSDAIEALTKRLFPLADIITPNIPEAAMLGGEDIHTAEDMPKAAKAIYERFGVKVLLKGGHLPQTGADLYYDGSENWIEGKRIDNHNTHGTGCTLSSAVAANLALGNDLKTSVINAKKYIEGALSDMLDLGKGSGPLNHMYILKK